MESGKYRYQIGTQLKQVRESQGWTIEQVAEMAEVKPVTIEKIEAGAFDVRLSIIGRVCEVLGCSMNIKTK
jgi:transcriptional regulator with XRE-family HTH domain